jgi:hypothetical protein
LPEVGIMPLPELFFVYDNTEHELVTFLSEAEALACYNDRIGEINDEAADSEYDGDEVVYFGQVFKKAEVVPVALNDEDEELFSLVSFDVKSP